jgi:hypothetical protein
MITFVFNPTDTNDYTSVTDSFPWVVSPALLSASAAKAAMMAGQAPPAFTGTLLGVVNGDNITASYNCSDPDLSNSVPGTYAIVPTLNDPNGRLPNYTVNINDGTLTVSAGAIQEINLAQWTFETSQPAA